MRQRNIKNLDERLAANSAFLIEDPRACRGRWAEIFGNDNPIMLEIGCGKGKFITSRAAANPDVNYIAAEGQSSVVLRAMEKAQESQLCNLRIFIDFIHDLRDYFEEGELSGLYLNFSDPWPKARHARRRLTSNEFFKLYDKVLTADGTVEFKTDNRPLFDFSVEELKTSELFVLDQLSYDLHNDSKMNQGNIMTEYEAKFSSMGNPICKLIAKRR